MTEEIKLRATIVVFRDGEQVNELVYEGLEAVQQLSYGLCLVINKKRLSSVKQARVKEFYNDDSKIEITSVHTTEMQGKIVTYKYVTTYEGEDLNNYYDFL